MELEHEAVTMVRPGNMKRRDEENMERKKRTFKEWCNI
jgi:hypothetical protein